MNTTFKGYANYGLLAHEYQTIFTADSPIADAVVSDELEITLPEGFGQYKNCRDHTVITTPDGESYLAKDILSSYGNQPVLSWRDGQKGHRVTCDYKEV